MKINILLKIIVFISFLLPENITAQTVSVDLSKQYQIIRGFGGMNHTIWIKDLNEDNREKSFGNKPGEMGLSILRIHLDPNPARFNLELPTAKHAIQKGALVFATPWNAPDALTITSGGLTKVNPAKYDAYVDHLNAFDSYMNNNGAPLYCISVQNEPDWGEWTRWTASEMLDFMANYANNLNNKVMAPESFQFRRNFSDPILNNEKAAANLEIVGGHIYGGGLFDYPLARQKGKEVWMTEHLLGSGDGHVNNWDLALTVGKEINDCMQANFNAYVWWYIRRFYGLITDDGNITDKGYVISQFSKFIRPGAIRVDASIASGSLVDVSSYKTDTSLVIVVINRNTISKKIDFNIKNGTINKLTKFTTSSSKKMINEGDLTVSGGIFSATFDAKSVTTFTTHARNGGKNGNIKPKAFAGNDLTIKDTEGTGNKTIVLDGSLSNDIDGKISNYSWSINGEQIAWKDKTEITVPMGNYEYVLTVTDNDGATDTDTVKISLISTNKTEIWLEAECGTVGNEWEFIIDPEASNGTYVTVKTGLQSLNFAAGIHGTLTLPFLADTTGNYNLYARVNCPTADDDSFWLKLNNGGYASFNGLVTKGWEWKKLTDFFLTKGQHKITFTYREDGAKLDKLLISNTGLVPIGLGQKANNCIQSSATDVLDLNKSNSLEQNYPNPFRNKTYISFEIPDNNYVSLKIYNSLGEEIIELAGKEYLSGKHTLEFNSGNLPEGIYFYKLITGNFSECKKMIVN